MNTILVIALFPCLLFTPCHKTLKITITNFCARMILMLATASSAADVATDCMVCGRFLYLCQRGIVAGHVVDMFDDVVTSAAALLLLLLLYLMNVLLLMLVLVAWPMLLSLMFFYFFIVVNVIFSQNVSHLTTAADADDAEQMTMMMFLPNWCCHFQQRNQMKSFLT